MSAFSDSRFCKRMRYRFDNFMSKGGSSIFLSLLVVFVGLLLSISLIRGVCVWLFPDVTIEREGDLGGEHSFLRNMYVTFLQMTDPGNMAQDIQTSPGIKIFTVCAGLTGIIMLSSLIAFITTALDQRLHRLRRGHSKVFERDHTLILGWNERIVEVLRELIIANESAERPVVVILADRDKEEMDEFLALHVPDCKNTRIVTRSGPVSSLVNLEVASVETCKSVIVLAQCPVTASQEQLIDSDISAIKAILALVASKPKDKRLNIVAEVFLAHNRKVAEEIAPREVTTVDTNEILAKILVQTSRSVGLSVAYGEILSFDGCELYFHQAAWQPGATFGKLAFHFPDGVPLGLKRADGSLLLNPSSDTTLRSDDAILILAEDDSSIEYRSAPVAAAKDLPLADKRIEKRIERELLIGWTPKVDIIIREYGDYLLEGSQVDVMLRAPDDAVRQVVAQLNAELETVTVGLIEGNPLNRDDLLQHRPFSYDNIIVLSQSGAGGHTVQQADSETIIILLLLKQIFRDHADEAGKTKLITEILDSDNQSLVATAGVYEFIISNRFISMLLAQISEDADIKQVYDDLFAEDGSEIYLKPIELYLSELPASATFADMIGLAQKRHEVALGVKIKSHENDMQANFGVKLIPEKNMIYTFQPGDTLIVLAEDES